MKDKTLIPVGEPLTVESDEPLWAWLRALLVLNLVMACAEIVSAIAGTNELWNQIYVLNIAGRFWLTPSFITSFVVGVGMPVAHLVCSIGCLKRRPPFRTLMLVYCASYLGFVVFTLVQVPFSFDWNFSYVLIRLDGLLARSAVPLMTFFFLTRSPIRTLFIPPGTAFEVVQ